MLLNQYHITSSEWELKSYQRSLYLCHKLCFCMMSKVDTSDCYMLGFLGDKRWLSSTLKQAADLCSPVSARDKLGTKGVNPVSLSYDKCHEALRQLSCVKVGQCENRGTGHTFVRVLPKGIVVRDTHLRSLSEHQTLHTVTSVPCDLHSWAHPQCSLNVVLLPGTAPEPEQFLGQEAGQDLGWGWNWDSGWGGSRSAPGML